MNRIQTRRHAAKLYSKLGPEAVVAKPWFLPWSLYHFVGTPGGYKRPPFPAHLTTAEYPGVFREWARLDIWRQRKHAGVPRPAKGLWVNGFLPLWAQRVSREMDQAHRPYPAPTPGPPPPAPDPVLTARAQRVLFSAWRPLDALQARSGRVAFSADLNVGGDPRGHRAAVAQAVGVARNEGKDPSIWGNQSQVGIDHMYSFAQEVNAGYIIWQAETVGEMVDVGINLDGSTRAGSPLEKGVLVLIGNANAWTPDQRKSATVHIETGHLSFIQETYTNSGDPWPDAYGTQGVPAASIAPGVGWDRLPLQLPEYKPHTPKPQWETMSPYLPEDFNSESWAILPY